ncbi:thiamine biosynthesis protein ThiI [Salmonella enterica subsp. enterica]|uniref:Thiamine biosynthesis protein ThiI n=1 Tax=Salmonella enterica I TaxID=59201 RepID=A0A447U8N0_SALET|nr:thiamine biosynthesis protein ThiI [Salmonella enterica subsp. enterica]
MDEQDDKPLKVEGVDVVSLPFYKLSTKFGDLDQSKTWLAVVRTRGNEPPAGALSARAGL